MPVFLIKQGIITNTPKNNTPQRGAALSAETVQGMIDNRLVPMRGAGVFPIQPVGVAEGLAAGDQLVLVFHGAHKLFHLTGSSNRQRFRLRNSAATVVC
jgi:hypothetical protein